MSADGDQGVQRQLQKPLVDRLHTDHCLGIAAAKEFHCSVIKLTRYNYVMLVFAGEDHYHIGIWYCYSWCELGRRVIASFVCNLIYLYGCFDSKIKIIWLWLLSVCCIFWERTVQRTNVPRNE